MSGHIITFLHVFYYGYIFWAVVGIQGLNHGGGGNWVFEALEALNTSIL